MPPKRKRGGSGETASRSSSSTSSSSSSSSKESLLYQVLDQIHKISLDKGRCTDLLTSLVDGKCMGGGGRSSATASGDANNKEDHHHHVDWYWLLLASHLLTRLIVVSQVNSSSSNSNNNKTWKKAAAATNESTAIVLAVLSYRIASTLLADRSRLERSANAATAANTQARFVRSALGRTIVSVAFAGTLALQKLLLLGPPSTTTTTTTTTRKTKQDTLTQSRRQAVWMAWGALEMVVYLSPTTKVSTSIDGWHCAMQSIWDDANSMTATALQTAAATADSEIGWTDHEQVCLTTLLEATHQTPTTTTTTTSKRGRRAAKQQQQQQNTQPQRQDPSALPKAFEPLVKNAISFEGRISIRRWASMALVWLYQGQKHLLDVVLAVLAHPNPLQLECPARTKVLSASAAASPRSRPRGKVRGTKDGNEPTSLIRVPGNVACVTLGCRLLQLVTEAGAHCGARAPAGGMDTFATVLLGSDGKKRTKPAWTRPDTTHAMAMAVYRLLGKHAETVRANCRAVHPTFLLLNDETPGPTAAVDGGEARYYPQVHKTLEAVCRAVSTTTTGVSVGSVYLGASKSMKKFQALASGYILQTMLNHDDDEPFVDAKLLNFCASNLSQCLKTVVHNDLEEEEEEEAEDEQQQQQPGNRESLTPNDIVQQFGELEPLEPPVPLKPPPPPAKSRRGKKTEGGEGDEEAEPTDKTTTTTTNTEELLLTLYLRAVVGAGNNKERPSSALFTLLLRVIECCYNTSAPISQAVERKRTRSRSPHTKRKRRKVAETEEETVVADEGEEAVSGPRLGRIRSGLAADLWNILRCCMSQQSSSSRPRLHRYLRESFTTHHIGQVVRLSHRLDTIMSKKSMPRIKKKSPALFFAQSEVIVHDRSLWSSHTNFCQTLGRGQVAYDPRKHATGTQPILGDSQRRLAMFKEVVAVSNPEGGDDNNALWPLSLSPALHSLVTSNLVSEPILKESSPEPESFLVKSFVDSIEAALAQPALLQQDKGTRIALSLRDGRLLLIAVTRLPQERQISFTNDLVRVLAKAIAAYTSDANQRSFVTQNPQVSAFLARLVTVTTTLLNIVSVGASLRDALFLQAGPAQYPLPFLRNQMDDNESSDVGEGSWYQRERCYMGMFADWESPIIPDATLPSELHAFTDETLERVDALLSDALALGFESAQKDKGQLLFSAWNAAGRKQSWDQRTPKDHDVGAMPNPNDSPVGVLLRLREDICRLNHEVSGDSSLVPDSLLTRVIRSRLQTRRRTGGPLPNRLKDMVEKAAELIERLVHGTAPQSRITPALCGATAVYLAFCVSLCTTALSGGLTRRTARSRRRVRRIQSDSSGDDIEVVATIMTDGEESESDYGHTVGGDEARIDEIARLHDACNAFGAAPCHPDWLDDSCSFRDGVTAESAAHIAKVAVHALTQLNEFSFSSLTQTEKKGFAILAGEASSPSVIDSETLYRLARVGLSSANDGGREEDNAAIKALAVLSGVDEEKLAFHLRSVQSINERIAKDAWLPNSSQRILGALQDQNMTIEGWVASASEYRAGGEWELLLSDSLLASCVALSTSSMEDEMRSKLAALTTGNAFGPWCDELVRRSQWRRVCHSCVSHLMPAVSLLRFSLSLGKGRQPHPLSLSTSSTGDESASVTFFNEELPEARLLMQEKGRTIVEKCLARVASLTTLHDGAKETLLACRAVACNVLIDSRSFFDMEAVHFIVATFSLLFQLQDVGKTLPEGRVDDLRFLVGRLLARLGSCEASEIWSCPEEIKSGCFVKTIASLLDDSNEEHLNSVGGLHSNLSLLGGDDASRSVELSTLRSRAVGSIVSILSDGSDLYDGTSRSCVARLLRQLAESDFRRAHEEPSVGNHRILKAVAASLDDVTDVTFVVGLLLPSHADDAESASNLRADLCSTFAFAASVDHRGAGGVRAVLDSLVSAVHEISRLDIAKFDVLNLLFLLGAKFQVLDKLGNKLVAMLAKSSQSKEQEELDLIPIESLLHFVSDINAALKQGEVDSEMANPSHKPADSEKKDARKGGTSDTDSPPPRACTFVLRSGFHAQHWYNCYTCGLVFDKGCCTLCALTCHKDHDVAYSRYSSFFCDCGAEAASNGDQSRIVCKCITMMSAADSSKIFREEERLSFLDKGKLSEEPESSLDSGDNEALKRDSRRRVVGIAVSSLRRNSEVAVAAVKSEALTSWIPMFFRFLHEHGERGAILGDAAATENQEATKKSPEFLQFSLRSRKGRPTQYECSSGRALSPIRAAEPYAFKTKHIPSSTDRMKSRMLSMSLTEKSILAADSRGRVIVAEGSSIAFFSAFPLVNTRYLFKPLQNPCERAQMSILGSASAKFNVFGMSLCRENERHLAIWGSSEVSIVVLNPQCDGVERTINISIDLDPNENETDFVVKCEWIPGSQSSLAVVCGTYVKFFDIAHVDQEDCASPLLSYSIAYDAVIRDVAAIKFQSRSTKKAARQSEAKLKIFLLVDTGRLYEISVQLDSCGDIEDRGTVFLEQSGNCIDIPTHGIRPYAGTEVGNEGSTTRSMGEGSMLKFLNFGQILLYKCASSCVVAMTFDQNGTIDGAFEFLPHTIGSEILGAGSDDVKVRGPFNHWTEMGLAEESDCFRVICAGKSGQDNKARLLCVDYNGQHSKVSELNWPDDAMYGSGHTMSSSFDGLAAFSAPFCVEATSLVRRECSFVERGYLCVLASSGGMLVYGEDVKDNNVALDDTELSSKPFRLPKFSRTLFEKLKNASEVEELRFGGDGVGSDRDSVKAKLSVKNSVYLMSPAREGCTLTLRIANDRQLAGSDASSHGQPSRAIVALRILVGSTSTDCVPRRLHVQGRPFDLTPATKRWYDLPLTMEEIVQSIRNGFVTLGIGPSFESAGNPLVDAIEVYATDRDDLAESIPTDLACLVPRLHKSSNLISSPHASREQQGLILGTKALSHLFRVVDKQTDNLQSGEAGILKLLIQKTALDDDSGLRGGVIDLLNLVKPEVTHRQAFLDEGTLIGLQKSLTRSENEFRRSLESFQAKDSGKLDVELLGSLREVWQRTARLLEVCVETAAKVAMARPRNYLQSTLIMVSGHLSKCSIAANAVELIMLAASKELLCTEYIPAVVRLTLTEIGINAAANPSTEGHFATFSSLTKILRCGDHDIVQTGCFTISSFLETHRQPQSSPRRVAHLFPASQAGRNEPSAPIAYQCDSCALFPITDARFTLLEGDHDIDLCRKCYQLGREFAQGIGLESDSPVVIQGRTIGADAKLTCALIGQMQPVPIDNGPAIVEQVEQALQEANSAGSGQILGKDQSEGSLQRAIRLSQQSSQNMLSSTTLAGKESLDFQNLTEVVFVQVLNLARDLLTESQTADSVTTVNLVVSLLLELLKTGDNIDRVKRFVRMILEKVLDFIAQGVPNEGDGLGRCLIVNLIRATSRVLGSEPADITTAVDDATETTHQPKSKEKTDPRFVCEEHGVPAVRRRCTGGKQKNRRFYVCGMERKLRCGYFKWADNEDDDEEEVAVQPLSAEELELASFTWQLLLGSSSGSSLNTKLCKLLEKELSTTFSASRTGFASDSEDKENDKLRPHKETGLSSLYSGIDASRDRNDGVGCSQEKMKGVRTRKLDCSPEAESGPNHLFFEPTASERQPSTEQLVEAALDLVSVVGVAGSNGKSSSIGEGASRWFALLCEIICMGNLKQFRVQAKVALRRLCGGRKGLYHSVRDRYIFSFQVRHLLRSSQELLSGALCVKEQARQCGEQWHGDPPGWENLSVGSLLGTSDLISEDRMTLADSKRIRSTVDELLAVTRSRGENWRHFCGMPMLSSQNNFEEAEAEKCIFAIFPPILSLFWVACTLSGPNQVNCMKLLDAALPSPEDGGGGPKSELPTAANNMAEMELDSSSQMARSTVEILLADEKGLDPDSLFAFLLEFVLRGKSCDLRKVASQVGLKLLCRLSRDSFADIFMRMVSGPLLELSSLGCTALQYLQLLQSVLRLPACRSALPLNDVARLLTSFFVEQMYQTKMCTSKGSGPIAIEFAGQGKDVVRKRFDMSSCVQCHRAQSIGRSSAQKKARRLAKSSDHGGSSSEKKSTSKKDDGPKLLPEQLRPFTRCRLESSTDASVSSEFATFVQLKGRLSISEVHLSVNEPRGRFVKAVAVWFTPRQVNDASQLKSADYQHLWQRCVTLSLSRGATRVSAALPVPITAANLKLEYIDFYDRPGGSRAADGTIILHCPRCTRVVNNAHGVCGNCGEVAFQCRKCRHINYDRLDAFLCVECGYCSSGGFSYDLTAGVALNAVAIVDDESQEWTVKVLRNVTKVHQDLQSALKERSRVMIKKRSRAQDDVLGAYGPAMKRALMGELPEMAESSSDRSSRSESLNRSSSAANRARSLLRLARHLRGEGGGSLRSRGRDILIRRELSIEDLEDADSDILGILNAADGGRGDPSDPLSRLVANIYARGGRDRDESGGSNSGNNARRASREKPTKASLEECEKLFQLMREAERECYELQRRLDAWNRLESDALHESVESVPFKQLPLAPTSCSKCAGPVTLHLLILAMRLFQTEMQAVESVIDKAFIRALFLEPPTLQKDLFELKRLAITTVATKSEKGAGLILEELRCRLKASDDSAGAGILGKLLENDFPMADQFCSLATSLLNGDL